jgi:hypothetical protein
MIPKPGDGDVTGGGVGHRLRSRRSPPIPAIIVGALTLGVWLTGALDTRAEDFVVRDSHGRRTGTVEKGFGDTFIRRDAQGRRIGTVERGTGGLILRDTQGKRIGTVDQGSRGKRTIRDAKGKRIGTVEAGPGKSMILRDADGRRSGRVDPR